MTIENDFKQAKELFNKRQLYTKTQPYLEHIELFLGLLSQEYAEEISSAVATHTLAGTKPESFFVEESSVKFHWQTNDDQGDKIDEEWVHNDYCARSFYGSIFEHKSHLFFLNAKACGIYVAINEIEGSRRTKDNVIAARAIWIEDDEKQSKGPRAPSEFPLPYSFVVETSRLKYHYYWLTYSEDLETWEKIQVQVMTKIYGSDPGANGRNRALRVPGFWHKKKARFATRIVHLTGEDFTSIEAVPSEDFIKYSLEAGGKEIYAFTPDLCDKVKRYDWEEILNAFGENLTEDHSLNEEVESDLISIFDPVKAMEEVITSENYHQNLHALCMHFANFVQDTKYVTDIVQSLMCRVPESNRDNRWQKRFNDIKRSAKAAVSHKIDELALATKVESTNIRINNDVTIHDADWIVDFPTLTKGCEPLTLLMEDFTSMSPNPIRSFNFATIISLFALLSQNIPVMPVLKTRKPNGCHLMLARSAGGKDLNISGPIRALAHHLLQGGYLASADIRSLEIVYSLISGNAEITSLSAFHKWATSNHHKYGAIWRNTECTSIIAKMSDENTSVSNLAEVVINIQDGIPIPPVTKAGKEKENLDAPLFESYNLLFATQPASIKRYMNPRLLYKGVIGRFDYYIPDKPESNEIVSFLDAEVTRDYNFSLETLDFIKYVLTVCSAHVTSTSKGPFDEISRNVPIHYDENWVDPNKNGPNRQKHVDWDKEKRLEFYSEDIEFRTFIDRVAMSSERYLTVLTFMQHLWECHQTGKDPFATQPVTTPDLIDLAISLGDYQYEVRANRIWTLIARDKGLDEKHQAMLDAIKAADAKPSRWQKVIRNTPFEQAYLNLFAKEHFMPLSGVLRYLSKDTAVQTKEGMAICAALSDLGFIEFVKLKQVDIRISNRPLKNVVRLTAQGRL